MAESVRAVVLALRILENLTESREEKGVSQLARELGTTKARIFRHLHTLRERGYVIQNERTQRNRVGPRLYLLGRMAGEGMDVIRAVRPAMERLRDRTGQTAVLAGILDARVVILDFLLGTNPIQIGLRPGSTFEVHATSLGRIALAFGPDGLLDRIIAGGLTRLTEHTTTDPKALRTQVAEARARGWATAPEETFIGINALAAPVRYHDGTLAGMLAVFGPLQYIPARPAADQLDELLRCARSASRSLGWRDD